MSHKYVVCLCCQKCATAGNGIAALNDAAGLASQICFGIDYDFATHKCYFHTDESLCPNLLTIPTPIQLVAAPSVINILLCEYLLSACSITNWNYVMFVCTAMTQSKYFWQCISVDIYVYCSTIWNPYFSILNIYCMNSLRLYCFFRSPGYGIDDVIATTTIHITINDEHMYRLLCDVMARVVINL